MILYNRVYNKNYEKDHTHLLQNSSALSIPRNKLLSQPLGRLRVFEFSISNLCPYLCEYTECYAYSSRLLMC